MTLRVYGPKWFMIPLTAYLVFSVVFTSAFLVDRYLVDEAGAVEPVSALETTYDSSPGHGPSLSATCAGRDVIVGYHPWDRHEPRFLPPNQHRNFQVWHHGVLVVNTNDALEDGDAGSFWALTLDDYEIRYVGKIYKVKKERCDTPSTTTTTPSTTTTSEPPTTTTTVTATSSTTTPSTTSSSSTAPPLPSTTSTSVDLPTTTSASTTTAPSTSTAQPPTELGPPATFLTHRTTPGPAGDLPVTGNPWSRALTTLGVVACLAGLVLLIVGIVWGTFKKRYDYGRN